MTGELAWQSTDLKAEKLCLPRSKVEAFCIDKRFKGRGTLHVLSFNNGEDVFLFNIVYLYFLSLAENRAWNSESTLVVSMIEISFMHALDR